MYKQIEFKHLRSGDPWPLFMRAIDWIESKGKLKPVTVMIKNPMETAEETEGLYRPRWERIYIYRHPPVTMELALVHELIHSWQCDGLVYATGKVQTVIPPADKRQRYLCRPWEIEAYWYMNEYSLEHYGSPIIQQSEYAALGSHLPHLVLE